MHAALKSNLFLVKERVGILKASNSYDVFDPNTSQKIMDECSIAESAILLLDSQLSRRRVQQ